MSFDLLRTVLVVCEDPLLHYSLCRTLRVYRGFANLEG
jgi:hypothetical protein